MSIHYFATSRGFLQLTYFHTIFSVINLQYTTLKSEYSMNKTSCVFRQVVSVDVSQFFRAFADHCDVFRSILYYCSFDRQSIENKIESQQYFTTIEKKIVMNIQLQMSNLKHFVRIKYISYIAFNVIRYKSAFNRSTNSSNKN